jgi:hypothetical protein
MFCKNFTITREGEREGENKRGRAIVREGFG